MHHLSRRYALKKERKSTDETTSSEPKRENMNILQSPRKLMRVNGAKFDYTPSGPLAIESTAPLPWYLDSLTDMGMNSFRVEGKDGEVDGICQYLELMGPEDFEIPREAYALMLSRLSSNVIQPSKKPVTELYEPEVQKHEVNKFDGLVAHSFNNVLTNVATEPHFDRRGRKQHGTPHLNGTVPGINGRGGGIKGDRPPLLIAPPPMTILLNDNCSTSDLMELDGDRSPIPCHAHPSDDAETGDKNGIRLEIDDFRLGETVSPLGTCSSTASNDDEFYSTATDLVSIISPDRWSRINITNWTKVERLGSGSYGTVYKGFYGEGIFFAIKEVSLLEQGSQGRQSIYQLEQEIKLLSQFKHENIVRYLGTEKDESNFYIFLELVNEGSLASLYEKCHLHDSVVSAYTRQILLGLKYLHDRDVVHRDIKCANILVASHRTVKLADFGLAKVTKLNDLKSCKGTVFWMAPEVIKNNNQGYGVAADIWSLGCTVLEMLTRKIPYHTEEFQRALFKIITGELPSIPDNLSTDANDFIRQCLRVNPNDRPSAAELLDHQFVRK